MTWLEVSLGSWLVGGLLAALLSFRPEAARVAGAGGCLLGCLVGLYGAVEGALGRSLLTVHLPWSLPMGTLSVQVDALSAFFLVPTLLVSALSALYGTEYLRRASGAHWLFYNLLVASMVVVLISRNAVLFLVAWEVMALTSFFLVTCHDEQESVRQAGVIYLVATHLGTFFLLVFFLTICGPGAELDFPPAPPTRPVADLAFLLALVGFGTKAGFVPLHVWLPRAHPAAPSHVSALLSGVMIKTGIYGLLRALLMLGPPSEWWGWVLLLVGVTSGVLGVLLALAQHDLKRLLAYHSVENIGIIAIGMGLGVIGVSREQPFLAATGFAGALLHVFNHAIFKSLLFLGAGSVLHATHTVDLERMGGLLRRMPVTGATFLTGSAAICGLPPLNGFVSEFLIFLAGLRAVAVGPLSLTLAGLLALGGLALIGGLAAACFSKAFGIVFLGEPRTPLEDSVHDPGPAMRIPMLVLAGICAAVGLGAPVALSALAPALASLPTGELPGTFAQVEPSLVGLVQVTAVLVAVTALLAGLRRLLLARRKVDRTPTWDCGYLQPSARMEYTASSFAQPLTRLFGGLLRGEVHLPTLAGPFPQEQTFESHTPDAFEVTLFARAYALLRAGFTRMRWIQHGRVHLYILYLLAGLLGMLIWELM